MRRNRDKPERSGISGSDAQVWDPLVRLFHWGVVSGCALDLFLVDDGQAAHRLIGYIVAGALVTRFAWGFLGRGHARFSDFAPTPEPPLTLQPKIAVLGPSRQ